MSAERILVVDDEPDICELVSDILTDEGFSVTAAETAATARHEVTQGQHDLVLLDIWMPDEDGITLLKDWKNKKALHCPVIMMSGHGTVETAVEATRLGAFGFIEKPLTTAKLISSIRKALESQVDQAEETETNALDSLSQPIGSSATIVNLIKTCKQCAKLTTGILAIGEEGSGRSTCLHYIHKLSARVGKPFRVISEETIRKYEADNAGWSKLKAEIINAIKETSGGTLFFQNIDQANPQTKARLVDLLSQLLMAQVFQRFDVRVFASLQDNDGGDLRTLFEATFAMIRVDVSPLKEHVEDIPELVNHFIDFYCANDGFPYRKCSIPAQNALLHYHWPSNVAGLKLLIQELLVIGGEEEISLAEVKQALASTKAGIPDLDLGVEALFNLPLREAREAFEKQYLIKQLGKVNGSVSKLAELVGMERTHLYRKLRALGIGSK